MKTANDQRTFHIGCQLPGLPGIAEGKAKLSNIPPQKRIRLWFKRHLSGQTKRNIKKFTNRIFAKDQNHPQVSSPEDGEIAVMVLKEGDRVRVKSMDEIKATLNSWREYKFCRYMDSMWQFCGTEQKVVKSVERFVDERDYQIKKASGVVLLENLFCPGTDDYGRCDRSCFYFWRVEWLDKIEK